MSVIISNGPTTLATPNGFYRVEAYNLGIFSNTGIDLGTQRNIAVTFANAGNCQGIILHPYNISVGGTDRSVKVTLQENVTGTWTDRVSQTLTASQIVMGSTLPNRGWIVPFVFASPYAVDTTAGKWRFAVIQTGGTSNNWNVPTSDGTNIFYATWCDNALSFTNNDCVIFKDLVQIDQSATFKGILPTGDTANAVCAVICNGADLTQTNMANLVWANPPASSYTLTIDGRIIWGAGSAIRIGTSTNPIPYAQQAIVDFVTPTVGTSTVSGTYMTTASTSQVYSPAAIFLYGAVPTMRKTTLSADAAAGQANIVTTDSTGWGINDVIAIGKEDIQSATNNIQFTIQSISGTNITLTANLSRKRLAGATVFTYTGYGIKLTSSTGTNSYGQIYSTFPMNYAFVSGVYTYNVNLNVGFIFNSNIGTWIENPLNSAPRVIEKCVSYSSATTSSVFFLYNITPIDTDLTISECYTCRVNFIGLSSVFGAKMGRTIIDGCIVLGISVPGSRIIRSNNYEIVTVNNCRFENMGTCLFTVSGFDWIFTNNYFYGNSDFGTVALMDAMALKSSGVAYSQGNTFNRCAVCWYFIGGTSTSQFRDRYSIYGNEYANTAGVKVWQAAMVDLEIADNTGAIGNTPVYIDKNAFKNSQVRLTNYMGVANNDLIYTTYGNIVRTGDSLTDTTVRTSGTGKFAIRFEPIDTYKTTPLEWKFDCPTGNVQNKTMTVGVWCKINAAAYYAGVYQLPRLTLNYDDGTIAYTQAAANTGWQLLAVTFAPTTTFGKIWITLSARTDATTTNAYVYWDDASILYPAGYKLDLGGMDLFANGYPVTPPIATVLSANDVWGAPSNVDYGANTMGNKVRSQQNPSILIGGKYIA